MCKKRQDAVAESIFPQDNFPSTPKFPPLCFPASPPSLPSCLHTTHLPSALPHRRVRILGRCWVSTVSQLNKTIWKQSGLVNVPAQSDPCPFVAVEKNGLSERRGRGRREGASKGWHTISVHGLALIHPPSRAFTAPSPPRVHPDF